jgi:uncharacterized membrane protein (DUF106 family)
MAHGTAKAVEAILKKDDKVIAHILHQNKELTTNIDKLKDELRVVENQKEELENECDSITKSKNIIQGYMKNIYEMNKLEKKLKKNYEISCKQYRIMYYIILLHVCMFNILIFNANHIDFVKYTTFVIVIILYTLYYHKNYQVVIQNDNRMIIEKLASIYKATDMVNDLMDSL